MRIFRLSSSHISISIFVPDLTQTFQNQKDREILESPVFTGDFIYPVGMKKRGCIIPQPYSVTQSGKMAPSKTKKDDKMPSFLTLDTQIRTKCPPSTRHQTSDTRLQTLRQMPKVRGKSFFIS